MNREKIEKVKNLIREDAFIGNKIKIRKEGNGLFIKDRRNKNMINGIILDRLIRIAKMKSLEFYVCRIDKEILFRIY